MKSVGILYLCTGDYYLFWNGFHESFEKNFLPDTLKRYYVFTDKPDNIHHDDNVHAYYIDPLPWPLITLLRFHYFIRFRNEITCNDYLMFANSNLVCRKPVSEDEFLPKDDQDLSSVLHPYYYNKPPKYCTYERNPSSSAYVPYNAEGIGYMMGCLYCGHTDKFMRMSEILAERINEDFNNRKIALWHDESQYNRYLLEHRNVRVLTPSYACPEGANLPFEKKIEILNKSTFFNVNTFKGDSSNIKEQKQDKSGIARIFARIIKRILRIITPSHKTVINFYVLRDTLLGRHI